MAIPMQQYAQPVTQYIQTTGALQKMAQSRDAAKRAGEIDQLRMEGMRQDIDLSRRQGQQQLSLGEVGLQQKQAERQQSHLQDMARAAAWADTPEKWEQSLDFFEKSGFDVSQFRGRPELRDMVMRLGHPQTRPQALTQFEKLLQARSAAPEGSYERQALEGKIAKESTRSGMKVYDAQGNLIVDTGGSGTGLDRPNIRESQEKIISAGESLARLERIKKNYDPEFLTYWGKLRRTISDIKSKAKLGLSDDERKSLRQYRRFKQGVNAEFNQYRRLITGAAAAQSELAQLKEAVINPDLSPDAFEAAYNEYVAELKRTIEIRNELLAKGIKPGTDQFKNSVNDLVLSGYKPSESELGANKTGSVMQHSKYGDITEDDIAETMRANNMTREQVLQRLKE